MKNFSYRVFIISALSFGLLALLAFFTSISYFDGIAGTGYFLKMSSIPMYFFSFPIVDILLLLGINLEFPLVVTGLAIDCMFYGFLTERIFSIFKKR
jgi:hypothetical protein